jgi:superoxide reductase
MTDRREFLKGTLAAAAALVVAPQAVRAAEGMNAAYTNIIYTAENPGRWAKKAASHAPQVNLSGDKVQVVTPHPMSKGHFIVRHTLVLSDGTIAGDMTFTWNDKPTSEYELPKGYKGKLYATSFCNLHDFWLTEVDISG